MTTNDSYLERQRHLLEYRRQTKKKILKEGGQQSLSHSYKDIMRIDYAIKRIEGGQYGMCCNCGGSIEQDRLSIIPEAPLCTECATSTTS